MGLAMPDAIEIIRDEHEALRRLAASAAKATSSEERQRDLEALRMEVRLHASLARDIFYPSLAAQIEDARPAADMGRNDHARQEEIIGRLGEAELDDERSRQHVQELLRALDEHATREEDQLLPRAEAADRENLFRLGDLIVGRREELVEEIHSGQWDIEQIGRHRTTVADTGPGSDLRDPSAIPRPPRGSKAARDIGVPGVVAEPEPYPREEGEPEDTV